MNDVTHEVMVRSLVETIKKVESALSFTIFEIGALPLEGQTEPFYQLLDFFPDSQIVSFEVDESLCEQLNKEARPGHKYYPVALGRKQEKCTFLCAVHYTNRMKSYLANIIILKYRC